MHLPKINLKPNLSTLILILLSASQANATSYNFIDLGTLGVGNQSYASAINNSGKIVGWSLINNYSQTPRATLWSGTTITDLGAIGDANILNVPRSSVAIDINDLDQIVGYSDTANSKKTHATLWSGFTVNDLGTLGGNFSYAYSINNSGKIVGTSEVVANTFVRNAALWDSNGITNLSNLDNTLSEASAINNLGQIIGSTDNTDFINLQAKILNGTSITSLTPINETNSYASSINDYGQIVGSSINFNNNNLIAHATLWDGATVINLGTLGGNFNSSAAIAINNIGMVVGYSSSNTGNLSSYVSHATLWNGTSAIDLNTLLDDKAIADGWILNNASDINDNGWIVGNASNSKLGFSSRAFLLMPVPESETYSLLLTGLGLLWFVSRRKQVLFNFF
jgi:probable HAF family extracellular repeat protein